ncbi:MAG: YqaJ viral recombinase family protein, partial [Eubacterium sp.]|nr:YqaJ viral recombinase family protein [Eubacterium sp.]
MKKLIYTKDMPEEEWLNYRRLGIGGSDASTILGLNPFNSILRLWEDKTGRIPVEAKENEYTHFGHVMEPVIRKEFERRTGHKVRRSNFILQSEEYPYLLADVDGFTKDEEGTPCIFEAKTASEYKKKVWEEGVPEEYQAQVQHYMLVTGFTKAYVAAI